MQPGKSNRVPFRTEFTHDERVLESERIRKRFPNLIPIICERSSQNKDDSIPFIDKRKFLVPPDLSMAQFIAVIRKRIKMQPVQALYVFINGNILAPTSSLLSHIFAEHKSEDGFLYMTYSGENTFG